MVNDDPRVASILKLGQTVIGWQSSLNCACTHNLECASKAVGTGLLSSRHSARQVDRKPLLQRPHRAARTSAPFASVIPGNTVAEQVLTMSTSNFLNLYNAALVGRIIITWFPNPPAAIAGPLATICDPYLNLFRGIIPPLGGTLDLSPILAFLALDLVTNTAQALPAEMPAGSSMRSRHAQRGRVSRRRGLRALWQKPAAQT